MYIVCIRGYTAPKHAEPETDSDGDGGVLPKLGGRGHLEFSGKGIPHGSLHFPEQLKWAGHIHLYNTEAPEASHRTNIKKAMDRVRKSDDMTTSVSMIAWGFAVRTWGTIIGEVGRSLSSGRTRRRPRRLRKSGIYNNQSKLLRPTSDIVHMFTPGTFSPLRAGQYNLMSRDARVSYNEVGFDSYMCTHI